MYFGNMCLIWKDVAIVNFDIRYFFIFSYGYHSIIHREEHEVLF